MDGDIWEYRESLRASCRNHRCPTVLIGSGALRASGIGPCADWGMMLAEVARQLHVTVDRELLLAQPTVAWEVMIRAAASATGERAWELESAARRIVADLVKESEREFAGCPRTGGITPLSTLVQYKSLRSIVTLNFTPLPFSSSGDVVSAGASVPEYRAAGRSIWCIHGSAADPSKMRLGVVRYAALVSDFIRWRDEYRGLLGDGLVLAGDAAGVEPQHRFLADILESPLLIVGCGLRHAEWTLWWMLATKARNEAGHPSCPSAMITADAVSPAQEAALQGLHCRTMRVRHHSDAWSTLEFLLA